MYRFQHNNHVIYFMFAGIKHLFHSDEDDWGFSTYIPWHVS